ncbi:MuF-C-terminal domain-containing protein [Sphingopyxis sp. 113P3]|uniref:MuF-C-terminal domain-containing protein n=1 Tax=Sphingopyxis sp. (strain 113P3) TaxID=292913 RepID=UPI0006AD55FD|nr:hypothetical protein [Sphingopyxis sp. 113P3]ALC13838.1 phosphomevalonate kinase [Sphingopyxis sp. 113P3]
MAPPLPGLDYYDQRFRSRPANEPVARIDPIEAEMRRERDRQTRLDLLLSASPDTVGRATTIAKEIGVPPMHVEDRLAEAEKGRHVRRFMSVAERYPAIGKWAVTQPRGAAAASDDWDSLSLLGKTWRSTREVATGIFPSLSSGLFTMAENVEGAIGAVSDTLDAIDPMPAVAGIFSDLIGTYTGYNPRWDKSFAANQRIQREARAKRQAELAREAEDWRPKSTSWIARELLAGTESIPMSAAALITRDPKQAAGVFGTLTGAGEYQKARDAGLDLGSSLAYGARQGAVEALTEHIPAAKLLGDIAARSPLGKMLLNQLVREVPGEQVATLLQDFDQWVTLNPDKTLGEFIAERPDAARQTLLGTIGAVGTTTAVVRATQKVAEGSAMIAARRGEADRALREGDILAKAGAAAEKSKLRERDPEAFAALMRELAEDSGATDVYIPAEAIQQYMQSDGFDPDSWAEFEEESLEAMATGGDVVMPVERVLTAFPGTPAWEALRDHMRLSPGGMSRFEAESFNLEVAELRQTMEEQAAAVEEYDREMMEAREALLTDVTEKLQTAGYTPSVARTQAELLAARYETRAMRKGQRLTGREFADVDVVQILPEKLALRQKNDGLDRVIDAMRRGTEGAKRGPSLLEFISKRGGIDDVGGDIASMGGDKWHRSAPFRKRLTRSVDKGQASMLSAAASDTAPEDVFRAAISAGYFPELAGREEGTYDDALDNRMLLDAIGEELRGNARYAEEVDTTLTDAAQELATLLANEGLDPASATRKQIRDAIAAYSARNANEGRGYLQAGLRDDIQAAWSGTKTRGFIDLGPVPQALVDFGLPAGKLQIGRGKINAIANKHDLEVGDVASLAAMLEQPWAIYPTTLKDSNRVVVALPVRDRNGDPILCVIEPNGKVATVTSVYGKKGRGSVTGDDTIRAAIANARAKGLEVFEGAPPARDPEPVSGIMPEKRRRPILSLPQNGKPTSLEQSGDEKAPRGRIVFPSEEFTGAALIELFKSRNLSTFLHETGHLWLEELRYDALSEDATNRLKDDWATVQDWFAANGHPIENGVIPVEAHEMWARGVEQYLMEGKAPVPALRSIFEQFRAWLTSIYRSVKALRSPLTPEIRRVMDRLIATDDDIALASREQSVQPLLTDGTDMTKAEWEAYQRLTADARIEARGQLLDKTVRDVRARNTKKYREMAAELREEIEASVDERPAFRAIAAMRAQPIDRRWVVNMMGEEAAAYMPRGVPPLMRNGGVHPDTIAEQSGFATAYEMIEALTELEIAHRTAREEGDQRGLRERIIEEELDIMMRDRYGEPLTDGSIEREAIAAVHNDLQGEVIAAEVRVLGRKAGEPPTPYSAAQEWARQKIRSGKVSVEAMPGALQRYARASKRAAREAEAAYLERNIEGAFRAKQQQMLNNALYSEAKKAHEEVEAARQRLNKIASKRVMKSVDQEYLEQAQALLEAVDIKRRTQKGITRQGKWEEWSQQRQAEGYDIVVPSSFEATIGKENWTRLTVEHFLGLDEAVRQIIHLGRLKRELQDGQDKREFELTVTQAVQAVAKLPQRPPSDLMEPSRWDAIKSKVAAADAALLKMETVFDWLDSGDSNGIFNRIVFRPLVDAQENERIRMNDILGQLRAALEKVPADTLKRWSDKITAPELINRETGNPFVMTREMVIAIALNTGNSGNYEKLLGGYGWSATGVEAMLARVMTQEEWAYVQEVWDIINSLWPDIEAMEKRVNDIAPEKVEARPVQTKWGVLKGGYYPVVYDPRRNYESESYAAKGDSLFEGIYTRATTPKGFTKERTNVERPIHLSLGVIHRHVGEVIHDLTHREAIMQADKFLQARPVMKAVDDSLGPEVRKQFRPWLQRIANEWAYDRAGQAGVEGFVKKARLNATIVGMGFRATTILLQAAGYSNSFETVGLRWVSRRLKDVGNPEAWNFVLEKSKEVRARMDTLDRDIRDNVRKAAGQRNLSAIKKFAFHGIGYMDRVVVIPTWLGAYDKAIAEGMSEDDAVYAADKAVRQSQGAGAAKDLAAIQSGRGTFGEAAKLLTMFYSYMSAFYQRQRSFARDVRAAKLSDGPGLLARAWWLFIVPPLLSELLAGRTPDDDDDESWAEWALSNIIFQIFGPVPVLRDIGPTLWAKATDRPTFGYRFTPAQGGVESIINVGSDLGKIWRGEETKRATRNAIETTGYFTGLTTGQMAVAAQFLVDVGSGDANPDGIGEWWRGLTTGKTD